ACSPSSLESEATVVHDREASERTGSSRTLCMIDWACTDADRRVQAAAMATRHLAIVLPVIVPTATTLFFRRFFHPARDGPHMTGRIDDPAGSIAPELGLNRREQSGAALDGTGRGRVDILYIHVNHDRRIAVRRRRRTGWQLRPFGLKHEHR